jgi:hypothetical protein
MDHYDQILKCRVFGTDYDPETRVGVLHVGPGECAEMNVCIKYFERDYPDVEQIDVDAGGFTDTRYILRDGRWWARDYLPPSSARRSARCGSQRRQALTAVFMGNFEVIFV